LQAVLFIALAPLAGFRYASIHLPLLMGTLVLSSLGLTAFGFALAWLLDNIQAYHAIQMTLLVPLWVLSGAMFPPSANHPAFAAIMRANPMTYTTSAIRDALYGGASASPVAGPSLAMSVGVVAAFAVLAVLLASWLCYRKR